MNVQVSDSQIIVTDIPAPATPVPMNGAAMPLAPNVASDAARFAGYMAAPGSVTPAGLPPPTIPSIAHADVHAAQGAGLPQAGTRATDTDGAQVDARAAQGSAQPNPSASGIAHGAPTSAASSATPGDVSDAGGLPGDSQTRGPQAGSSASTPGDAAAAKRGIAASDAATPGTPVVGEISAAHAPTANATDALATHHARGGHHVNVDGPASDPSVAPREGSARASVIDGRGTTQGTGEARGQAQAGSPSAAGNAPERAGKEAQVTLSPAQLRAHVEKRKALGLEGTPASESAKPGSSARSSGVDKSRAADATTDPTAASVAAAAAAAQQQPMQHAPEQAAAGSRGASTTASSSSSASRVNAAQDMALDAFAANAVAGAQADDATLMTDPALEAATSDFTPPDADSPDAMAAEAATSDYQSPGDVPGAGNQPPPGAAPAPAQVQRQQQVAQEVGARIQAQQIHLTEINTTEKTMPQKLLESL